jgi:CubicO group peptidase (beta-lactamase class C family)
VSAAGLRDALATRVERGELPGVVWAVADGAGERVEAIGSVAFDDPEPMRRDTVFRIASVTKPMVAAVTMMLVEDGRLALDEPVDRLLPELADRRVLTRVDGPLDDTVPAVRAPTVEDLLTFRLGHGMIMEPFQPPYPVIRAGEELRLALAQPDPRTPHGPDEWIRLFATLPLMDQPGTVWRYNTGALVLSVLVARAAGKPLDEVLQERLFGPLGMASTGFRLSAAAAQRLPAYYMTDFATGAGSGPVLQPVSQPDEWSRPPVFPSGAAGLVSTVDDVLAFGRFLLAGGVHGGTRLLSAASVGRMTTNHLTDAQIAAEPLLLGGRGWGYGMAVAVVPDDVSAVPGRYGWDGGYGTTWFNDPASGRIGVLMSQCSDVIFNGTVPEFTRLALGA